MPRSVIIVQARLGSSRLPGKVLQLLSGETVLRHVLRRCQAIQGSDQVCCAIPVGSGDNDVASEALRCGVTVVRGSEADVLSRYHQAAVECGAEIIMRITSDCPLIDPVIAAQVLNSVANGAADYACNNMPRSWPHGLDCEAFSITWLEHAAREATLPEQREHVTPYLRTHPLVKRVNLPGPGGKLSAYRWTLDTPQDLEFFRQLFARNAELCTNFDYRLPLSIVEHEPALSSINNPEA